VRALHVLKDELIKRGYPTTMHYEYHTEGNFVIYPEIVSDNPLGAKHYCHWLLNKGSQKGLTFGWAPDMGCENLLTVNIVEPNIFYQKLNERNGVAYWQGKGSLNAHLIPDGAIQITKEYPATRQELANLLASVEYVVSFDDYTAITLEATILGTPVMIATGKPESKERLIESGFPIYGICFSEEELPNAKIDVLKQDNAYKEYIKVFDERIDNFINITQAFASSIS
jgi:hypothetical protein